MIRCHRWQCWGFLGSGACKCRRQHVQYVIWTTGSYLSRLVTVSDSLQDSWVATDTVLASATHSTDEFCRCCDLQISVQDHKSWIWTNDAAHRHHLRGAQHTLQGKVVGIATDERDLGAHIVYTKAQSSTLPQARFAEAQATARRVQLLPVPYAHKVVAIRVKVLPRGLYATEVARPPQRICNDLRSAVTSALWSHERLLRSKAAVCHLLRQVDPSKEVTLRPLMSLRRFIAARSVSEVWPAVLTESREAANRKGFLHRVAESMQLLEWEPEPDGFIMRRFRARFHFQKVSYQRFLAILEEDWGACVARTLTTREAAEELHHARLDVPLTSKLLRALRPELRSSMEAILGASHRWCTRQRQFSQAQRADERLCSLCGGPAEGPRHMWTSCAHETMVALRVNNPRAVKLLTKESLAFRAYGWILVPTLQDSRRARLDEQAEADLEDLKQRVSDYKAVANDPLYKASTDGSAKPPQIQRLCQASWAYVLWPTPTSPPIVKAAGRVKGNHRSHFGLSQANLHRLSLRHLPLAAFTFATQHGFQWRFVRTSVAAGKIQPKKVRSHCKDVNVQSADESTWNDVADLHAKRVRPHVTWVEQFRCACRCHQILAMWSFMSACRTAYLASIPSKSSQAQLPEQPASSLDLRELEGGHVFTLGWLEPHQFCTMGVAPLLKTADGQFAVSLARFVQEVKWHHIGLRSEQKTPGEQFVTSWLVTGRPVPVDGVPVPWSPESWLQQLPAWKRVGAFRAAMHQLNRMFGETVHPEAGQLSFAVYGCTVKRQPIPALQGRAQYPHRTLVLNHIRSVLLTARSKTSIMTQTLQPPQVWDVNVQVQVFAKPQ